MSASSFVWAMDRAVTCPYQRLALLAIGDGDCEGLSEISLSTISQWTLLNNAQECRALLSTLADDGHIILFQSDETDSFKVALPGVVDPRLLDIELNGPKRGYRPSIPPSMRAAVFARDGEICGYCHTKNGPFHLDHVHPVSRGGQSTKDNLIVACAACNLSKSNMTVAEWEAGK